jgi:hypothetical protein
VITANPCRRRFRLSARLIIGVSSNEEGMAAGFYGPYAAAPSAAKSSHSTLIQGDLLVDVHGALE